MTEAEKAPVSAKKEGLLQKSNQLLKYNVIKERKFKIFALLFCKYARLVLLLPRKQTSNPPILRKDFTTDYLKIKNFKP